MTFLLWWASVFCVCGPLYFGYISARFVAVWYTVWCGSLNLSYCQLLNHWLKSDRPEILVSQHFKQLHNQVSRKRSTLSAYCSTVLCWNYTPKHTHMDRCTHPRGTVVVFVLSGANFAFYTCRCIPYFAVANWICWLVTTNWRSMDLHTGL